MARRRAARRAARPFNFKLRRRMKLRRGLRPFPRALALGAAAGLNLRARPILRSLCFFVLARGLVALKMRLSGVLDLVTVRRAKMCPWRLGGFDRSMPVLRRYFLSALALASSFLTFFGMALLALRTDFSFLECLTVFTILFTVRLRLGILVTFLVRPFLAIPFLKSPFGTGVLVRRHLNAPRARPRLTCCDRVRPRRRCFFLSSRSFCFNSCQVDNWRLTQLCFL
mmetsp:Transcript_35212/g.80365  ORF Transcript_35212/g.80365 Transcript_35212/m.80365 type:complete len:226 (-) Transcript_35212:318-995(-)